MQDYFVIGDFGRNSTEHGLWTTIQVDAIGIKRYRILYNS